MVDECKNSVCVYACVQFKYLQRSGEWISQTRKLEIDFCKNPVGEKRLGIN